jgi:hypothetical protein
MAIFDVGSGDVPYFVCELLEGVELRARLDRGPLPPRKAIGYAIQIARGLAPRTRRVSLTATSSPRTDAPSLETT